MLDFLRAARLPGVPGLHDLTISDGVVTAITPHTAGGGIDLDGRFVFPGLWDHHVHFTQWVVTRSRLDLSSARSAAETLRLVEQALARTEGELTGYGFRDGLWPDEPELSALDTISGDRKVVLVSGDLHCAWVNSAALRDMGVPTRPSGLLRETEWISSLDRLDRRTSPPLQAFREATLDAARRGVVGIVEFENTDNLTEWPTRFTQGADHLRVDAAVWPQRLEKAIADGLRTGDALEPTGQITMGRLKIVVDGSLNTRTALCHDIYPDVETHGVQSVTPTELRELLRSAQQAGVDPAVHAIGDLATTQVLDAFEELGIAGTVEHAQLVAQDDFARFGRLGLTASIQPEHAMDDRDVADHHWAGRTGRSFAYRSLHEAGATLRLGSDAPVAPQDPWHAIAAATTRSRDGREAWHPEQTLTRELALAASTRGRSRVECGDVADLVVLEQDPLTVEDVRTMPVVATMLAGRWTWNDL